MKSKQKFQKQNPATVKMTRMTAARAPRGRKSARFGDSRIEQASIRRGFGMTKM